MEPSVIVMLRSADVVGGIDGVNVRVGGGLPALVLVGFMMTGEVVVFDGVG